jgi:hypothetical protein
LNNACMQQKPHRFFSLSFSLSSPCSIVNCPTSCHYPLSWRQACAHACCALTHGGTYCFDSRHRKIFNFFSSFLSLAFHSKKFNNKYGQSKKRKQKRTWCCCYCCCY